MSIKCLKPGLGTILSALVALPLLIALGFWQLQRAEEKQILQNEYDRRAKDNPVRIERRIQKTDDLRFYRVIASGYYDAAHQILIDNRTHKGRAGYHVITPLIVNESQIRILVNRGWVPVGQSRQILPDVIPPTGLQTVVGLATVPLKGGFQLGELPAVFSPWQIVWPRLDIDHFQKITGLQVQPVVMLLEADSKAGGFIRNWKRLDAGIAVHHGYAFQWFSLALVLLVMLLFVSFKKSSSNEKSNAG